MKIFIGSDHQGFALKSKIVLYLSKLKIDVEDIGPDQLDPDDDFPQFAYAATTKVIGSEDKDPRAILICGGGQGMAIAANRARGIRAVIVWDSEEAEYSRKDNDSNVLCLPARIVQEDEALWQGIIDTWLNTKFAAATRYIRRNKQLDEI